MKHQDDVIITCPNVNRFTVTNFASWIVFFPQPNFQLKRLFYLVSLFIKVVPFNCNYVFAANPSLLENSSLHSYLFLKFMTLKLNFFYLVLCFVFNVKVLSLLLELIGMLENIFGEYLSINLSTI